MIIRKIKINDKDFISKLTSTIFFMFLPKLIYLFILNLFNLRLLSVVEIKLELKRRIKINLNFYLNEPNYYLLLL